MDKENNLSLKLPCRSPNENIQTEKLDPLEIRLPKNYQTNDNDSKNFTFEKTLPFTYEKEAIKNAFSKFSLAERKEMQTAIRETCILDKCKKRLKSAVHDYKRQDSKQYWGELHRQQSLLREKNIQEIQKCTENVITIAKNL